MATFGRFYSVDLPGGGRVVMRVDITESKRRENELAAAQDRYRMLFDANAYPMVVIDRETRDILAVNDAAVAQYGWSREEALTMTSDDFYPPEDLATVKAPAPAGRSDAGTGTIPGLRHRTKDGTIIDVELSARQIELGRPGPPFSRPSRMSPSATAPNRHASRSPSSCASRRRWRRSASSPAASRTTSTTS